MRASNSSCVTEIDLEDSNIFKHFYLCNHSELHTCSYDPFSHNHHYCDLPIYWTFLLYQSIYTPWCRVLLEKLTGLQLVKKFPSFHGTRRFITALTSVRHLSLSWASPIQSIYPHPTYWRSVLILSTHLRLGLNSGLFPSGFPTKARYTPLSSPIRATCSTHLILLDIITRTMLGEQYKSFSSSLCSLLHSPITLTLLCPNILLNTMFWNTVSYIYVYKCTRSYSGFQNLVFSANIWRDRGPRCHSR